VEIMLKHIAINKVKLHEKYFIIPAVLVYFLGVVLYLSAFVYQGYLETAIRRNNYIRITLYTDMVNQYMMQGTLLILIGIALTVIAYFIYQKRMDEPLY
jgi:ABC-type uncharacterized transport system fused permease/ATPase subunit